MSPLVRALPLAFLGLFACTSSSSPAAPASDGHAPAVTAVTPGITWPTSAATTPASRNALALLGDETTLKRRVDLSPVPVLVPGRTRLEAPVLMVEGEYYALSAKLQGATIAIQGTRPSQRHADIPKVTGNRSLRGGQGFVTTNEGIRTASFVENGAAYSVDVECSTPNDARCTDEAFVIALAEELVYVGGRGR